MVSLSVKLRYFILGVISATIVISIIYGVVLAFNNSSKSYIKDSETAEKIAEAVLLPMYGEEIYNEKPFIAILKDDIWIVKGSITSNSIGGVLEIQISKRDGKIIDVYHGK